MEIKITGFGACMVGGYPLPEEVGFLRQAAAHLRQTGNFQPSVEIIPMGGFPVVRARKHFAKKALAQRPDVVVLQFGSTDASAPLRRAHVLRHWQKRDPHVRERVSPLPPTAADLLKWQLRNLASELLLTPPITPLGEYLTAMLGMVEDCRRAGIRVVVLSPFVMGAGRSHRFARQYARKLAEALPRSPQVRFLDALALLAPEPRAQMLLGDGFHLSAAAHKKLGVALGEMLAEMQWTDPSVPNRSTALTA